MPHKDIQKNSRDIVRVTPTTYEGYELVDIRIYSPNRESGKIGPTKKGISVNVDVIPELIDALIWSMGQPCDSDADSDERKLSQSDLNILAQRTWELLSKHGTAVHWDSAEKMVFHDVKGFSKWDLHYVLVTRKDLFERVAPGCFRALQRQ